MDQQNNGGFPATCAECGTETTLPFEPKGDRPVYCRDCFKKQRSGGNDGPREMHDAVCAACNQPTTVPFKPTGTRPVYCRDCFQQQRS